MELKKIEYKGFIIIVDYSDHMGDTFSCRSNHLLSDHIKTHINGGHATIEGAVNSIKKNIDLFLTNAPKDYIELANAIHKSLEWSSYEDCELNPKTLAVIVENFIKYKTKKS
jgi:hypothetical protein